MLSWLLGPGSWNTLHGPQAQKNYSGNEEPYDLGIM